MKQLLALTLFLLAGLVVGAVLSTMPTTVYAADSGGAPGKDVFLAQKCNMCHSVSSAGIEAKVKSEKMRGPDLDGCCKDKDAAWITQFLKKEVDLDGAKHKGTFKGTDEELKALVAWIKSL
jgi:mono/diheme cytochrome c family protein